MNLAWVRRRRHLLQQKWLAPFLCWWSSRTWWKTNWLREVHQWLPKHRPTVVHGDGAELNAFSDVFIVNYDILDRHVWLVIQVRFPRHGGR